MAAKLKVVKTESATQEKGSNSASEVSKESPKIAIPNAFFENSLSPTAPFIKLCNSSELPATTSYWLSRILQKLDPLNKLYQQQRIKLIEKWCDKDEEGKPVQESDQYKITANMQDFHREFQELLEIKIDLDIDVIKIPVSKLPDGLLSAYDYTQLLGIVEFVQ